MSTAMLRITASVRSRSGHGQICQAAPISLKSIKNWPRFMTRWLSMKRFGQPLASEFQQ